MTTPPLYWLDPDDDRRELSQAWNMIRIKYGDTACPCPHTGEVWQYMGTHRTRAGIYLHTFRHRNLRGTREYTSITATPDYTPRHPIQEATP